MSETKFRASTGVINLGECSGIFQENDYQHWFLLAMRANTSVPVVVKSDHSLLSGRNGTGGYVTFVWQERDAFPQTTSFVV